MATIADELNAISVEHGYTGAAPKTIAGAIDALADTLAGTDVEERRTIAGAVKALAPYIGTGGGSEQYGTGIEMTIKSNIETTLFFAVLTTTDVTDEDSYKSAIIGKIPFWVNQLGTSSSVNGGAHIAVGSGSEFVQVTMMLDDAEFTDFEVKTIGNSNLVLFTVPETSDPDSLLVLDVVVD